MKLPSRGERGQSLVEFTIVIPIFLAMLFGIFDLGRVVWANNSLAQAAREGARYAIVRGGSALTACPVGPPGPDAVIPSPSSSCPYPSPSKQGIRDVALQHAVAGGTGTTVTVCYGDDCAGDIDTVTAGSGAVNTRGTPVTVRVTSTVTLITGSFLGIGNFSAEGSATMLVNH